MYRNAASRLRALKDRASSRALTRFASSSAVATKTSSGSYFSWLTGEHSSSLPPLNFPLKDVILSPPLPDYVEPGKTKITTLSNGLKIASEPSVVQMCLNYYSVFEAKFSIILTKLSLIGLLNRTLWPQLGYMLTLDQFMKHRIHLEPHIFWND
ncbi:unnamed protein product [Ilex paraguariensis]|uniref:Uncharacterized protein n=1 Tax=Ilex paraguariensis TaxID=185542 RepID=A0ABC8S751_9AQUA